MFIVFAVFVCVCVWATRFHWAGRDSTRKSSPATLSSSLELADLGRLFGWPGEVRVHTWMWPLRLPVNSTWLSSS